MARADGWQKCEGTWDRLKWARKLKWSTAEDAAGSLGEKAGTYRAYERQPDSSKHTPLDHQHAFRFARRMGVRWEWLLLGEGTPWIDPDENRERILNAYDTATEDRRAAVAEAIERLLKAG
jgi:hypothetical protein